MSAGGWETVGANATVLVVFAGSALRWLLSALDKRIERKVDRLDGRVDRVEGQLRGVQRQLGLLTRRVDQVHGRLEAGD